MARAARQCLDCGRVGPWDRSGRCPEHKRQVNNARDAEPARRIAKSIKYDYHFRTMREAWAEVIGRGERVNCARCGELITGAWDLDHVPAGLAPSHAVCNRSAGQAERWKGPSR